MSLHEKFKSVVNNSTDIFNRIIGVMHHSKKDAEKRLLCVVDKVVDYCLSQLNGEEINFNTIYIPCSHKSARQLCMRYLIHKAALTFNNKVIENARKISHSLLQIPENVRGGSRRYNNIREERRYWKSLVDIFGNISMPNDNSISLFVVPESDVNAHNEDRNPCLSLLFSKKIESNIKNNVVIMTGGIDDIVKRLKYLKKNGASIPSIKNIFIFHSRNRGRITSTYDIETLKSVNSAFKLGIKNCIILYISEKNFRLYDGWQIRTSLLEGFYHRKLTSEDLKRFITFTPMELDYIFNRECNKVDIFEVDDEERAEASSILDGALDDVSNRYMLEHLLSLSINDETIDAISNHPDINGVHQMSIFFDYHKQLCDNKVIPQIKKYINRYTNIAVVVNDWVDDVYRDAVKKTFSENDISVKVVNYSEFKKDGVTADYVVFWMYRYTDIMYRSFPNSFDPLPLRPEQCGLVIVNKIVHKFYGNNKHKYFSDLNLLLCSNFRSAVIGWGKYVNKDDFSRERFSMYIDGNEAYESDYKQKIESCQITFKNSRKSYILPLHSLVLYKQHECINVATLRTLLDEGLNSGIEIHIIDELVDKVKELINNKTLERKGLEMAIRRQSEYGLSQEEIDSDIELWRYLLRRKVQEVGVEKVFNDIFPEKAGHNPIERWTNFDYEMILPRELADQKKLFQYLGLNDTYYNIVRLKKKATIRNSRLLNRDISRLLIYVLTLQEECNDDTFTIIKNEHHEILELIGVNDISSLNDLISLLEVKFKKITKIERYDRD